MPKPKKARLKATAKVSKRRCPFPRAYMAKIGRRGGTNLKRKRGKKFFAKIAGMRKHFRGGRKPKNQLDLTALD